MMISSKFSSAQFIIVLAFIAMLILSFISFTRISRMNELSTQVNHSNLIQLTLQEAYSDLSDADSELSKHILTSDYSYKDKMMEFENTIKNSIRKIKTLKADDAHQLKKVLTLDSLIRIRFKLMSEELATGDKDYTIITSRITNCNAQIISTIGQMKQSERSELAKLEGDMESYKTWTPVTILTLEIIITLFLIYAYLKTARDLKIKTHLQNELQRQVAFVKAILDNSVDVIIVLDTQSNIISVNRKAAELLGITDEMIGKNILSLMPMAQNSKSHHAISQALKGEYVHIEKHKSQSIDRTLESFFIPLYTDNEVSAVIIIHHDISEYVKASEELELTIEKLRRLNLDLEQFAYVASHDLQEPLRKIRTYSDFAERNTADVEKLSGYLTKISSSAARMSKLIIDVLNLSRIAAQSSEMEQVDLNVVVAEVIQDLELAIEESQATIHYDALPMVHGHATQLSQVFANLIQNALKFCDKQPVIKITCNTKN